LDFGRQGNEPAAGEELTVTCGYFDESERWATTARQVVFSLWLRRYRGAWWVLASALLIAALGACARESKQSRAPGEDDVLVFFSSEPGGSSFKVVETESSQTVATLPCTSFTMPVCALDPSNDKIAVVTAQRKRWRLSLMRLDGSPAQPVTSGFRGLFDPAFSPDGALLAFTGSTSGAVQIHVVGVDGRGLRTVTDEDADCFCPVFTPDGNRLLYAAGDIRHQNLYMINLDGSGRRQLTEGEHCDTAPCVSPDGRTVAFTSDRDGHQQIYTMSIDGTDVTRLSKTASNDAMPYFSPDGSAIAFESDRDGQWEIYVMNADGRRLRNLSRSDSNDRAPRFRPPGSETHSEGH
jgi:WD40 repeat protein